MNDRLVFLLFGDFFNQYLSRQITLMVKGRNPQNKIFGGLSNDYRLLGSGCWIGPYKLLRSRYNYANLQKWNAELWKNILNGMDEKFTNAEEKSNKQNFLNYLNGFVAKYSSQSKMFFTQFILKSRESVSHLFQILIWKIRKSNDINFSEFQIFYLSVQKFRHERPEEGSRNVHPEIQMIVVDNWCYLPGVYTFGKEVDI